MFSYRKMTKIMEECIDYCPLQVLYSDLSTDDCNDLCSQYMDKNNIQQSKYYISAKEEYDVMYA